jgi:hypothetical protein
MAATGLFAATVGVGFALANGLGLASFGAVVAAGLGVAGTVANGLQVTAKLENLLPPLLSTRSVTRGHFFCCSAI